MKAGGAFLRVVCFIFVLVFFVVVLGLFWGGRVWGGGVVCFGVFVVSPSPQFSVCIYISLLM